ncbi:unnamed protein product [marine sediment metagenome]|uniref:DUF2283 domain-containing protein n=1 Tax=marine sediment metagenome TaxID=412755 RepID=X0RFI5_9ZZZZ
MGLDTSRPSAIIWRKMLISFDIKAKAAYVEFKDSKVAKTRELIPEVFFDFDEADNLLGIELLNIKKNIFLS